MRDPSYPPSRTRFDRNELWQFEMLFYIHYLRMEPERALSCTISECG
jgi:hypothetical protein